MKIDDIIINKTQSIKKCVSIARDHYFFNKENFISDYTRQDAAILNIQRACEQAIDLANYIVKLLKLGVPNESKQAFFMLSEKKIITEDSAKKMAKMIGFRNIVIHEYQEIDMKIVGAVIEKNLDDLLEFSAKILKQYEEILK